MFSDYLTITYNIILVILGINALIIVHEFGHFIVARMCGVRCDKFYIWFDFWGLKFFKFKWGQTEYGLGLFPLGGYVKMLGQEDNPGELRAEMERARAEQRADQGAGDVKSPDASSPNMPDQPTRSVEELNEQIYAPDSYLSKSVPQRLAIICAGVTMNFLFAIVCATAAYMVGVEATAPAVGNVVPGSPAWTAGLETGDRIVGIDGRAARVFTDINMAMVGGENGVKFQIERSGSESPIEKTIVPRKRNTDLAPMIGIGSLPTLDLASQKRPVDKSLERFYGKDFLESLQKPKLRLESVDGTPLSDYAGYMDAQLKKFDQPVLCRFADKDGKNVVEGEVPPIPMKETGIRFKTGPVSAVLAGSDAEKKGVKPGDTILSVDGDTEFDPLKLPQIILKKLNEGRTSVELGLRRKDGSDMTLTIELRPERIIPNLGYLSLKEPVASTALGLAWDVEPEIAGFDVDAPEATRQLPIGGKVVAVKLVNARAELRKNSFSVEEKDGVLFPEVGVKTDIPYVFGLMLPVAQSVPLSDKEKKEGKEEKTVSVRLTVALPDGATKTVDVQRVDSKDWFSTDRGLLFGPVQTTVKIENLGEALSMGTAEMINSSLSVYRFLKALFDGGISPRAMGGPVAIVQMAYMFADSGLGTYLLFLCLIGANLAVINILPIPVLDGGHVVFLLYEAVFRRPPNEAVQVILSYMGLALILGLMVWVVSLDLGCIARF